MSTYVGATHGDLDRAIELYRWNAEVAAAFLESLSYVEVALRNALDRALATRHRRLGRPGLWFDDPANELEQRARDDIARVRSRLRGTSAALPGKLIAELPFGFWRFLLARRYTTTLWPALRPAFPHLGGNDRRLLEAPVEPLYLLRNRAAHHEPLIKDDLAARHADVLAVLGAVDPMLRDWVASTSRTSRTLAWRPTL